MKLLTVGALIAVVAGPAGANALDLEDHSSSRQTLHFAGAGPRTLEVNVVTGAITVEGYDGSDVEVIVNKTTYARSRDDLEEAARDVKLDTADNTDTVRLLVKYHGEALCGERHSHWLEDDRRHYDVRYDFTIRVPKSTRLELCTINRGDIAVTGTQDNFAIHTINGRITLSDIAGSGEATTINGRVTASFTAAPRESSVFKTINGDVVLEMPADFSADLHMKTFNGGLFTDFETQPLRVQNVSVERHGNLSVYRPNAFTSVRAGNGGPELTLETLNGDVRVLRRAH
jgi:hypothetical protein